MMAMVLTDVLPAALTTPSPVVQFTQQAVPWQANNSNHTYTLNTKGQPLSDIRTPKFPHTSMGRRVNNIGDRYIVWRRGYVYGAPSLSLGTFEYTTTAKHDASF